MTDLEPQDRNPDRRLRQQIGDQLHASAAALHLPPGDLATVVARTRTRRHHQQLSVGVAVVVLLVSVVARVQVAGHGGRPVTVRPESNGANSAGAALKQGDIGVAWQDVDSHSALGYSNSVTAGGSLYALSTAPGVTDPNVQRPAQLYRSTDGVEWTAAAGPADAYLSDLSATGGELYAVGTGAATVTAQGTVSPLVVESSTDGGGTWQRLALPIDLDAVQADMLPPRAGAIQIASNATGVLVVAQLASDLDVAKFLPAGVAAPYGWVLTATGVDLLGPIDNPACPSGTSPTMPGTTVAPTSVPAASPGPVGWTTCFSAASAANPKAGTTSIAPEANHPVTRSFTWAQLGISGALEQAAQDRPFAFFAPSGKAFQTVALPDVATSVSDVQIAAGAGDFVVAATSSPAIAPGALEQQQQEQMWQSADGTAWTPTPAPPSDLGAPTAIGYLSGRLSAVGGNLVISGSPDAPTAGPVMATLTASGWSESPLSQVLSPNPSWETFNPTQAAIGPFGIVVDVNVNVDQIARSGGITVTSGAYELHILNAQWGARATYGPSQVVATTSSLIANRGGNLRLDPATNVVTLLDSSGKTLATFDAGQMAAAFNGVKTSSEHLSDRLLASRDGTTWSNAALDQLAGTPTTGVATVVVTANRFIVTAQLPGSDIKAPTPETVLVGAAR